jgi:cytochrome b
MSQAQNTLSQARAELVRVWDPLVRAMHWTVVVAFFVAYFTEDDLLTVHTWAGYVTGAVVVLRVLWGFVGPRRARFLDFLYAPATVLRYSVDLLTLRRGKRYLGHSPGGGLMVVVLLIALAATVCSGMVVLALEEGAGPLGAYVGTDAARAAAAAAEPGESRKERRHRRRALDPRSRSWREVHEFIANLTFVLVIVHIGGVLLAGYVHRENLIVSMFTGSKRSNGE